MKIFETVPDYINEKGTKFWLDLDLTKYCKRKELPDHFVYYIEDANGYRSRLLVKDNIRLKESPNLEQLSCFIDFLSLEKNMK